MNVKLKKVNKNKRKYISMVKKKKKIPFTFILWIVSQPIIQVVRTLSELLDDRKITGYGIAVHI